MGESQQRGLFYEISSRLKKTVASAYELLHTQPSYKAQQGLKLTGTFFGNGIDKIEMIPLEQIVIDETEANDEDNKVSKDDALVSSIDSDISNSEIPQYLPSVNLVPAVPNKGQIEKKYNPENIEISTEISQQQDKQELDTSAEKDTETKEQNEENKVSETTNKEIVDNCLVTVESDKLTTPEKRGPLEQANGKRPRIDDKMGSQNITSNHNTVTKQCLSFAERLVPIQVLLDCSYEEHMSCPQHKSLAREIRQMYHVNRSSNPEPAVKLNVCGMQDKLQNELDLQSPEWYRWKDIEITKKSWDQVAEYNDIIYLSPDAENVLEGPLPSNTTFIIGGLVDRNACRGLSAQRAEVAGVMCARLPIVENGLKLKSCTTLTCDHVFSILIHVLRSGGDWKEALLKNIPKRKQNGE